MRGGNAAAVPARLHAAGPVTASSPPSGFGDISALEQARPDTPAITPNNTPKK